MNNFEKITASPETLGAFLASLPIETGPWDSCGTKNCIQQDMRSALLRWLTQAAESEEGLAALGSYITKSPRNSCQ